MIYSVTYRRNNKSNEILVDAPGAKAAERYLLSQMPSARVTGICPARAAEFTPDAPVLALSPDEEKSLREKFMAAGLDDLNLSVRSYNSLRRSGINTVGELVSLTEDQLARIRNLGPKCKDEIITLLEDHGEFLALVPAPKIRNKPSQVAKTQRKPSLDDRIASVAEYTEDQGIKEAIRRSEQIRNQTLDICYEIPGYTKLPRSEANALYDLVKKAVTLSKEKEQMAVGGVGER